jgi:cysteine sulfinate desulfinase/cysteine desulfurase-like protein
MVHFHVNLNARKPQTVLMLLPPGKSQGSECCEGQIAPSRSVLDMLMLAAELMSRTIRFSCKRTSQIEYVLVQVQLFRLDF